MNQKMKQFLQLDEDECKKVKKVIKYKMLDS